MPWKEECVETLRQKFIKDWQREAATMVRLCEAYSVSRKTGYKWIDRFEQEGVPGLGDRSRAPLNSPQAISDDVRAILLDLRRRHPFWGPRKILGWLAMNRPRVPRPAASTVGDLFKRNGMVRVRKWRRRAPPITQPFVAVEASNDTWCTDFKGEFRVGNGETCYPLTISDAYSRFLLSCFGLPSVATAPAMQVFRRAFEEYGMPNVIRSDNGQPFGAPSIAARAVSRLGVWFIKLGIRPERIEPASPDQNGRHERMHWTLKQETALPARSSFRSQQRAFDRFRDEYNHERPHEALNNLTPATLYRPSRRSFPRGELPDLAYPTSFKARRARRTGEISWMRKEVFVSEVFGHEVLGLLEQKGGSWDVYCGPMYIGLMSQRGAYVPRQVPIWDPEYQGRGTEE